MVRFKFKKLNKVLYKWLTELIKNCMKIKLNILWI
jgi:hypothetical protein